MDKNLKKKILHTLRSPILLGFIITFSFVLIAREYYFVHFLNDNERNRNSTFSSLFDIIELADLKSMDLRFKFREEHETEAPVALLTIDDESVQEIGRWPWSREKIAFAIEEIFKYGGKAIAMDIVFGEPQLDIRKQTLEKMDSSIKSKTAEMKEFLKTESTISDPDTVLSKTIAKYRDKIVLGSFAEDLNKGEDSTQQQPYQDYCRNEGFRRINAEKFVKLNQTFIVNDEAEAFEELTFSDLFNDLFNTLENNNKQHLLIKLFNKKSEIELSSQEKNRLRRLVNAELMGYCDRWLTAKDDFIDQSEYQNALLKIFSKSTLLKDLSFQETIAKFRSLVKSHPLTAKNNWTINTDLMQNSADFTGSFNAFQDQDGTIRKAPLFYRTGNKIGTSFIPSIGLQAFLIGTGYQARIELNKDPKHNNQKIITKFEIANMPSDPEFHYVDVPVDGQGRLQINYNGGRQMIPHLPAKELFSGTDEISIDKLTYIPELKRWATVTKKVSKADFIKDKIFVFGATAIGIYDLRVTPFDNNYPGTEIHANIIANLFDKKFIRSNANEEAWMLWILVLIGIIFTIIIEMSGAVFGFFATLFLIISIFTIDSYLFSKGLYFAMVLPFFLVICLYPILTFYKYFTEERKKKQLRSTFSKYVSPAIVDEILKSPENVELGGKKAPMSVFFSDIRGFTTISETLDPHALTELLNRYLTPMTEIVFQNKGTLDKYMGDAIMAFFGAPISYPDHAFYACRCALQSLEKLKELQIEFEKQGLPKIDIGIGINTGEMNVGNMGSEIVRSYTVMGDNVNLGSRLESINKEYGTRIIISEFVQKEIEGKFITREVDWVKVKGKTKPVRIYELISEKPIEDDKKIQSLDNYKKGFELFHQMRFSEARTYFEVASNTDNQDELSKIYIERTSEYISTPPPPDWDGVYTMTTK